MRTGHGLHFERGDGVLRGCLGSKFLLSRSDESLLCARCSAHNLWLGCAGSSGSVARLDTSGSSVLAKAVKRRSVIALADRCAHLTKPPGAGLMRSASCAELIRVGAPRSCTSRCSGRTAGLGCRACAPSHAGLAGLDSPCLGGLKRAKGQSCRDHSGARRPGPTMFGRLISKAGFALATAAAASRSRCVIFSAATCSR